MTRLKMTAKEKELRRIARRWKAMGLDTSLLEAGIAEERQRRTEQDRRFRHGKPDRR